jgi:hypothetical protein
MKKKWQAIFLCAITAMALAALTGCPQGYSTTEQGGNTVKPNGNNTAPVGNSVMKAYGEAVASGESPAVIQSSPSSRAGTVYYVANNGDDSNSGTSSDEPWASIGKVNATTFNFGDQILFRAGDKWELDWTTGPLYPKGTGFAIGAYGDGPKPRLVGLSSDDNNQYLDDVIFLMDAENIEIRDLDIKNSASNYFGEEEKTKMRMRRGIHITVSIDRAEKTLRNYWLHDLYVHEVAGDSIAQDGSTPWDVGKRNGGIVFETVKIGKNGRPIVAAPREGSTVATSWGEIPVLEDRHWHLSNTSDEVSDGDVDTSGFQAAWFENIKIEKNVLQKNGFLSITFKQLSAWGQRSNAAAAPYFDADASNHNLHKYVVIQDNYIDHYNWGTGADGILCANVQYGLIRRNILAGCGTCAIENYNTDRIVVEYNEIYDVVKKVTGADSNGMDPDRRATNIVLQYNYVRESNEGILLCGFNFGSSVIRYNVIQSASKESRMYFNVHGDKGMNYVYNNIFYHPETTAPKMISSSGGSNYFNKSNYTVHIANNVFYSPNATGTIEDGSVTVFNKNWYHGANKPAEDTNGIVGNSDPFVNIAGLVGGKGQAVNLDGLKLKEGAVLIGAGLDITEQFKDEKNFHKETNVPLGVDMDWIKEAMGINEEWKFGEMKDFAGTVIGERTDIGMFQYAGAEGSGVPTAIAITFPSGEDGAMELNETIDMVVSFTPSDAQNKALTWVSSDPTVATVDGNGKVTPLASGITQIRAYSTAAPDVTSETLTVTVLSHVQSVTLDKENFSVQVGSAYSILAVVMPLDANNKNVSWSSSDPDIATVTEDGLSATVTGVTVGTATITVTTVEGNYIDTATVMVTEGLNITLPSFFENFESYALTEPPENPVKTANWYNTPLQYWDSKRGAHGNNAAAVDQYAIKESSGPGTSVLGGSTNKVGMYESTRNGAHRGIQLNLKQALEGNVVYAEFDWYPNAPSGDAYWGTLSIQDGKTASFGSSANTYDNRFITFITHSNGSLYYYLGNIPATGDANEDTAPIADWDVSESKLAEITPLAQWYKVKVVIDISGKTVSFEIKAKTENGTDGAVLVSKTNLPFAEGVTYNEKVESLRVVSRYNTWQTYIDNLYLGTSPFPVSEE